MIRLFASGGQSVGASALATVLPMDIQGWFPLGLTDLISLESKGLSGVFSTNTVQKHQFFSALPFYDPILVSYVPIGKIVALTIQISSTVLYSWLTGKDPDAGKDWGQGEKRVTRWNGWMASPIQWRCTWANSRRWWGTGKPGVLQSLGFWRVGHDWATEHQQQYHVNKDCEGGHPWFVPDLRGKASWLSPLSMMFTVGFYTILLSQGSSFLLLPS